MSKKKPDIYILLDTENLANYLCLLKKLADSKRDKKTKQIVSSMIENMISIIKKDKNNNILIGKDLVLIAKNIQNMLNILDNNYDCSFCDRSIICRELFTHNED